MNIANSKLITFESLDLKLILFAQIFQNSRGTYLYGIMHKTNIHKAENAFRIIKSHFSNRG